MRIVIISFVLLYSIIVKTHPVTAVVFSIYHNGERVGKMQVSKLETQNKTTYTLHSKAAITMLLLLNVEESIIDEFRDGKLASSSQNRKINGIQQAANSWNGNENIKYTVLMFYFYEPYHQTTAYSETFNKNIAIHKVENGIYKLKLPNGATSTYYYKNRMLHKVESETRWGKVIFVKEEP